MGRMARRLLLAVTLLGLGCGTTRAPMHPETPAGAWYVVSKGETLEDIAKRAGVPAEDILEINGLARAEDVKPGRLIFVLVPERGPAAVAAGAAPPALPGEGTAVVGGGRLRWPLANAGHSVGSPFGTRDGRVHEGIDLPAPTGTPVVAAADGEVVYAGDGIRGYGNLVVLQHPGDLLTVYAHNSALYVKQGQAVRAGDRVAAVGQTGRASGPHLHFEVRQGQIPRDPMTYLSTLAGAP
jgi:murein DD-endopeptidase MepM/ murein hydrolase activator NlpD